MRGDQGVIHYQSSKVAKSDSIMRLGSGHACMDAPSTSYSQNASPSAFKPRLGFVRARQERKPQHILRAHGNAAPQAQEQWNRLELITR